MQRIPRLSRADFQRMQGFKRLSGRLFSLLYGTIPGKSGAAAFVVSKKVSGSAVVRNRIKRRGRMVVRTEMPLPFVVVFIAKKGAAEADFVAVRTDIAALMAKVRASR